MSRLVSLAFDAVQSVALLIDLLLAGGAVWRREWGAVQWHLGVAAVVTGSWYVVRAARTWTQTQQAIQREELRTHTAQAHVAETMLRHISTASEMNISIGPVDGGDVRKH